MSDRYEDGESSVTADIDCHLNEHCGQADDDGRSWAEYTLWMWGEIERLKDHNDFLESANKEQFGKIERLKQKVDRQRARIVDLERARRQQVGGEDE